MDSWVLPDRLWTVLERLIPPARPQPRGGRPPVPPKQAMAAIGSVMRTGCPWRALTATRLCSSATAERRFRAWKQAGMFVRLPARCLDEAAAAGAIDWSFLAVDGRHLPAPLSATQKGGPSWLDRARQ